MMVERHRLGLSPSALPGLAVTRKIKALRKTSSAPAEGGYQHPHGTYPQPPLLLFLVLGGLVAGIKQRWNFFLQVGFRVAERWKQSPGVRAISPT